jgi:hypothetical protein
MDTSSLLCLIITFRRLINTVLSFRSPSLFYLLTVGVEVVYFHLITLKTHTTVGRTPLDEGSARRSDLYLTTQTLYKTNIHAPGEIRTHDPSKPSAADLRHWDRRKHCSVVKSIYTQYETRSGPG